MKRFELCTRGIAGALALAAIAGCSGGGGSESSKDPRDPDILISPVAGPITEAGGETSFSVVLNAKPEKDVDLSFESLDASEGTVSPASLTFTEDNWDAPQTALVTGVDDAIADGNVTFEVAVTSASDDPSYQGAQIAPLTVVNLDDETAGVRVGPVAGVTSELGDVLEVPVVLQSEPTAEVLLIFGTSDLTEGVTNVQEMTFTPLNWNAPQAIIVQGVDDDVPDGLVEYSVVFQNAASEDPAYANLPVSALALANVDNDSPGIIISPVTAATSEGDVSTPSVAVEVRLSTPPTALVTLEFNSSDIGEGDLVDEDGVGTDDDIKVVFDTDDWDVPQTVSVIGEDDSVADGDQPYQLEITDVTSTDMAYDAVERPVVNLLNLDDDSPGILVSPLSGLGDETGGLMSFTMELLTQPTADVTIPISLSNPAQASLSHASHTFTTVTWDNPVTVWIAGREDGIRDGNQPWFVQFAPAISTDTVYAGRKPANLGGITLDDASLRHAVVFDDAMGTDAYDVLVEQGWTVDVVAATADLESAIDAGTADLVIVESSSTIFPASTEASLEAWVTSGGQLILSHWDLGSTLTLNSALEITAAPYSGHRFVFPEPVELIDVFAMAEEIPFPLTGQAMVGNGQELGVTAVDGAIAARLDSLSGAGAIAATHADRVIVNGFAPDDMAGTDNDGDGISDMRELYENLIGFVRKTGSPAVFSSSDPVGLDAASTSQIRVYGVPRVLTDVNVSLHAQHPNNGDMEIFLVGPDGTRLELTTDSGGSGDDFGNGCKATSGRVTFDDDGSSSSIPTTGPVIGSFEPDGTGGLAVFEETDPNGVWTLEIVDDALTSNFGTLKCWSLHFTF